MAGKTQSWKKIRDERRKENFIGRGEPIRIFTENLQSDSPDYMVISITGEGGVGKSTLLSRFASIATSPEHNAIVVICDDKQSSPILAMGHIAKKLAEKGIAHKEFDEQYKNMASYAKS
jgi:ABC-type cobalamin/Fe3+-siderophores transport system ATPase subunit